MIVIQKLMPQARNLFEKFNANVNKASSVELWKSVVAQLKEEDDIEFDDWFKLKENVRNWYGRALVCIAYVVCTLSNDRNDFPN